LTRIIEMIENAQLGKIDCFKYEIFKIIRDKWKFLVCIEPFRKEIVCQCDDI